MLCHLRKKCNNMNIDKITLLVLSFLLFVNLQGKSKIQLTPEIGLMTQTIQKAINSCAEKGGGVVLFPAGKYISGGLELKSKVTLQFEKGAILQGSAKYADYKNDAFIFGKDLSDIAIQGEGPIDGVDCYNPKGEEGFRGPHCIRLIECKNITFRDFTIKNSANWAINCRHCSYGTVEGISIRGGHDGLHTRFCNNFKVSECDFRTGDDSFAGNDNRDFEVKDCKINTSCSAFRFGCLNLLVKGCKIWGPGEYAHKIENRVNMPIAFVHFSPSDEHPKLESGNWLIQDLTIENADLVYIYNFDDGLWQTGQPANSVKFERINAKGLLRAFYVIGDKNRKFDLKIVDSSFSYREGSVLKDDLFEGIKMKSESFFYATDFGQIDFQNVTLQNSPKTIPIDCKSGNKINISGLRTNSPFSTESFRDIIQIIK